MKLWRADTELWEAVEVECPNGGYPGKDAEGIKIFDNTHFETEAAAWKRLEDEAAAGLSLDIRAMRHCESALAGAKERVIESAVKVELLGRNLKNRGGETRADL